MKRILTSIFQAAAIPCADGSSLKRCLEAARKCYSSGVLKDDTLLHTLDFFCRCYPLDFDKLITKAKSASETELVAEIQHFVERMNIDRVPMQVYAFFVNELLAYFGRSVDPYPYLCLAEYDPSAFTAFDTLGAYAQSVSDIVLSADKSTVQSYVGGSAAVVVPTGPKALGDGAFAKKGMRYVVLPDTIKTLGAGAFQNCIDLFDLYIPKGITTIPDYFLFGAKNYHLLARQGITKVGKYAFASTAVKYGFMFKDLKEIGEGAFKHCPRVTNVELGKDAKSVGKDAFRQCMNLERVVVEGEATIDAGAFAECPKLRVFSFRGKTMSIGDEAFRGCGLTEAGLTSGRVGKFAFANNPSLSQVSFGDTVEIDDSAFELAGVESLRFDKATIRANAFKSCKALTEVSFRGRCLIDANAFQDCSKLKTLNFPTGGEKVDVRKGAFARCGLSHLDLPQGEYGEYCFEDNANLTSVSVGSTAITFDTGILKGCHNAKIIYLPRLCNDDGVNFLTMFGSQSYQYSAPITVGSSTYALHPLDKLRIGELRPGDTLPKGLKVGEVQIDNAARIPADFCLNVQRLVCLNLGPEVRSFEPGFSTGGAMIRIDPKNPHLVHENGLLLSKDRKTVLLSLDPEAAKDPSNFKKYDRLGAGVVLGADIDTLTIDSSWPVLSKGAFKDVHIQTLVIKDWSRLDDDAFDSCAISSLCVQDASPNPKYIAIEGTLDNLEVPSIEKGYMSALFRREVTTKKLRLVNAEVRGEAYLSVEDIAFDGCRIENLFFRGHSFAHLGFERCDIISASILDCQIGTLDFIDNKVQLMGFPASHIEEANLSCPDSFSLSSFHSDASANVTVERLNISADQLVEKVYSSIDVTTLNLNVHALGDHCLRSVNGKKIIFASPVREISDKAMSYSGFLDAEVGQDSVFFVSGKEKYFVRKSDSIAFHVLNFNAERIAFNDDIVGYTHELMDQIRENITTVFIGGSKPLAQDSYPGFSQLTHVVTCALATPLSELFPGSPIETVRITDDFIPDGMLSGLPQLTKVEAAKPLRFLGNDAFLEDSSLKTLPDLSAVESAGNHCFSYCESLTSIALPKATKIGTSAFSGALGIRQLTLNAEAFDSMPLGGAFSQMPGQGLRAVQQMGKTFYVPTALVDLEIHGGRIPDFFAQGFKSIVCVDPLTEVGDHAFAGIKRFKGNLKNLISVGESAFEGAALPKALDLPVIENVGERAFAHCGFTSLHFGPNLFEFPLSALEGFKPDSIAAVVIEGGAYRLEGCLLFRDENLLRCFDVKEMPEEISVDEDIETIASGAFLGNTRLRSFSCAFTSRVEERAFDDCPALETLNLFSGTSFVFPVRGAKKLKEFSAASTEEVASLAELLPDSPELSRLDLGVKTLKPGFFRGFEKIEILTLTLTDELETLPNLSLNPSLAALSIYGPFHRLGENALAGLGELKVLNLLDSKAVLGQGDLAGMEKLEKGLLPSLGASLPEVFGGAIPESLHALRVGNCDRFYEGMFRGAKNAEIELVRNSSELSSYAFADTQGCKLSFGFPVAKLGERCFVNAHIEELVLPEVESIGDFAFAGATINQLEIGTQLLALGKGAFFGVHFPVNLPKIKAKPFSIKDGCLFREDELLAILDAPDESKSLSLRCGNVAPYAFGELEHRSLEEVRFEREVALPCDAFVGSNVKALVFDKGFIRPEGGIAFRDCAALDRLTCSSRALGCTDIMGAFSDLSGLKDLTLLAHDKTLDWTDGLTALERLDWKIPADGATSISGKFSPLPLTQLAIRSSSPLTFDASAFTELQKLTNLELCWPSFSLDPSALESLTHLKSLTLPTLAEPIKRLIPRGHLSHVVLTAETHLIPYAFQGFVTGGNVVIESDLVSVGDHALGGCLNVSLRTDVLREIGNGGFAGATISCPEGGLRFPALSSLGPEAFRGTHWKGELELERVSIGKRAFSAIRGKQDIVIRGVIASIEPMAFENSENVTLYLPKSEIDRLDQSGDEWRKFRNFGKKSFFSKLFHSDCIKVKPIRTNRRK